MPEDLKLSQIGSSLLPPPFRGLHSPGVRKHCQIIFVYYFRISSIPSVCSLRAPSLTQREIAQAGSSRPRESEGWGGVAKGGWGRKRGTGGLWVGVGGRRRTKRVAWGRCDRIVKDWNLFNSFVAFHPKLSASNSTCFPPRPSQNKRPRGSHDFLFDCVTPHRLWASM